MTCLHCKTRECPPPIMDGQRVVFQSVLCRECEREIARVKKEV